MRKWVFFFPVPVVIILIALLSNCKADKSSEMYAGSASCIECHERFYKLWAPSHHGLAMQGVDSTFIVDELNFDQASAEIQGYTFTALVRNDSLVMVEENEETSREYPVLHALGGKYIYYFLTPFEKGRLQVVPLAYDIKKEECQPYFAANYYVIILPEKCMAM